MDHAEALRQDAAGRYVAGELAASEIEEFEEHYFSCRECAEELKLETAFAENARAVFRDKAKGNAAVRLGWWERVRAGFAMPMAAAACLLLVVGFQNLVTIPRLRSEVGQLSSGEPPYAFPLKLARGPERIQVPHDSMFLMPYLYPPSGSAVGHYVCDLQLEGGAVHKRVTVSAPPPGQPLRLMLLRREFPSGTYTVTIRGDNAPEPLATYTMDLITD